MREKELRLALVCYGGISLAVHIHGVTRELHKLARASKLYFSEADPARRRTAAFDALDTPDGREIDTERVYFDLLQEIGRDVQLKVVIDVIAGASAGGINGVMLGRALAHDLPLDALRSLWLDEADVERLMAPESRPGPLSKLYKRPVFLFVRLRNLGNVRTLLRRSTDSEIRAKLDYFLRARWFRPPFSGRRLSRLLLKACQAMGTSAGRDDSCLPPNQPLDLFVTVTDFRGYRQRLKLHDPAEIEETEHRLTLSFRHHRSVGIDEQGFNDAALPGLVFAARATSCFPGAFPPARLREIDQVCFGNARPWPERQAFIDRVLAPAVTPGRAAHRIAFIDGSVLNNKPFGPVIDTLPERVAHRQVDRRIVYVDPAPPRRRAVPAEETMPGFLRVISGALSVIPRNQPVRDELERLNALSEETRRLREVVDAARPSVTDTIARLLGPALRRGVRADRLADWRTKAHERAAQSAGFAYEGYLQLKLVSVLRRLAEAMARAPDAGPDADADAIEARLRAWAAKAGVFPAQADDTDKPWHDFLARFDVDYRVRRLRFAIRRINELYEQPGAPTDTLDALKGALYRYHGAARYSLERALAVDADAVLGPVLGEPAAPATTPETAPDAAPEP
ncbi:hypothetical protein CCR85_14680, partial [Rhodothalassium salexigens]|uniref:patatin-like protein n=1 Tax=Rhodothalassium salexigens TaxID=1086 RepID=UPI00191481AB|nr:hypothetical protein [Rhodothalassium salexigens]